MHSDVLQILRCPESHTALTSASAELIDKLNAAIREERLVSRAGKPIKRTIEGGLVRSAGDLLYPIVDGIPVMLRDEAIELSQLGRECGRVRSDGRPLQ